MTLTGGYIIYRVSVVEPGTGQRFIVFTTGATVGSYVAFRISARPTLTAGLYFVVDNFRLKKYTLVYQTQQYATDFNTAVQSGVNIDDNGQPWQPLNTSNTSLSVVGTSDKKIQVACSNADNSRLITDLPFTVVNGRRYLVKFTLEQAAADKRVYMEILTRSGGGAWSYTIHRGLYYTGSGHYQYNFELPAGATQMRVQFLRANTGNTFDGLNVPYSIDDFSVTWLDPQNQKTITVCDPPAGGEQEGLYRFRFNGKENDNEVKGTGNQQDYGMRIYDPRLGRFLSVDPISKEYPDLTPYQFASNTPIWAIDLDGLEGFIATGMPLGNSERGHGMVISVPDAAKINNTVGNWISLRHQQGKRNVQIAEAARQQAIKQGRADGDGIKWYTKSLVYLGPWWNSTAALSDANDGAVILSGKNLDGSKATTGDYVAAGVGFLIPFVSGKAPKEFFQ